MKLTLGAIAGLLFVSTVAVGQYGGGSPTHQAANQPLKSGRCIVTQVNQEYESVTSVSLAVNSTSGIQEIAKHVLARHPESGLTLGSSFPGAANPASKLGSVYRTTPSDPNFGGSPFPGAANPASKLGSVYRTAPSDPNFGGSPFPGAANQSRTSKSLRS